MYLCAQKQTKILKKEQSEQKCQLLKQTFSTGVVSWTRSSVSKNKNKNAIYSLDNFASKYLTQSIYIL